MIISNLQYNINFDNSSLYFKDWNEFADLKDYTESLTINALDFTPVCARTVKNNSRIIDIRIFISDDNANFMHYLEDKSLKALAKFLDDNNIIFTITFDYLNDYNAELLYPDEDQYTFNRVLLNNDGLFVDTAEIAFHKEYKKL